MKVRVIFVLVTTLMLGGCFVQPKSLTLSELSAEARKYNQIPNQEPLEPEIDVYHAIARALKYNLDKRVELMTEAVRYREFHLANFQGLPSLVLSSGYTGRNNDLVTSSRDIFSNRVTPSSSTSSDRNVLDNDIRLSWNVLDFGLSYIRARQAADKILLQREIRRRTLNRIVEDVRVAYWRAVASEKLLDRLYELENQTRRAIADSRTLSSKREGSPLVAVSYERDLLEISREIQNMQGQLITARGQLAALMSLPQNKKFILSRNMPPLGKAHLQVATLKLFRVALMNRAEIRELVYEMRMNKQEENASLLQMLPGIETSIAQNMSSNSLLYNPDWLSWSSRISWNLMRLFQYPETKKLNKAKEDLLRTRAMALTVAVMSQVYVSRTRYLHAEKEFKTAEELLSAQRRFLRLLEASTQINLSSEQELIREKLKTIVSEVRHDIAYSDLQAAYGNMFSSLGLDAYPILNLEKANLKQIADDLRRTWIGKGDLSIIQQINLHSSAQPSLEKTPFKGNGALKPQGVLSSAPQKVISINSQDQKSKIVLPSVNSESGKLSKQPTQQKDSVYKGKIQTPISSLENKKSFDKTFKVDKKEKKNFPEIRYPQKSTKNQFLNSPSGTIRKNS